MKKETKKLNIIKTAESLRIEIPASDGTWKTTLLFLWLLAWTISGMIIVTYYFQVKDENIKAPILVWLGFWAYFEFKIVKVLSWRRFGKEIIEVKSKDLHIKRDYSGKGKTETYNGEQVKDLRINDKVERNFFYYMNNAYWSIGDGRVAFDYFGKEITFGLQLDEKTAIELLKIIRKEIELK